MRQHNLRVTGSLFINGSEISSQGGSSINTGSLATTGSNTFTGNQIVTGSIGVSGSISVRGENVVSASQLTSLSSSVATTISASAASQLVYSSSVDSRLDVVEATASLYVPFSTSVDSRLDVVEATASLYVPFSASVDGRLDILELSSSLYDNVMSGSLRLYVSPDGKDSNDGSDPSVPFKTIKAAVVSLGSATASNIKRYTIFVGSGNYTEDNPIVVPPGVAIVGDTLRTVRLTAQNPKKDYFHCHDSNYFYGLRFLDLKYPAFAFSYPCSTATGSISAGGISSIGVVHSMTGYTDGNYQDLGIVIEGPDASGSIATATANVFGGLITQINVSHSGSGYTTNEKPHISIPAPESKRPVIGTSPYIQNCSSITGPFQISNGAKIPVTTPLPYDTSDVDSQGAGGGIRIDGNLVSGSSPLESFVADAFTQVNQGGPGHLVINKGYAQFVSCFTTFCTYGFKVANGGFANISNSVIDFGNKGLISKTYFPIAYNTGSALGAKTSTVSGFVLAQSGSGYTGPTASVTISGGGGFPQATAEAKVVDGAVSEIILLTTGSGYTSQPDVVIAAPTGVGGVTATTVSGKAQITGISDILISLESGTRGVDISSNMVLNGSDYLVTAVATVGGQPGQRRITTFPAPPSIADGATLRFHQLSNISTGGLVMEYVGSGVTYNALPKFGGVPIRTMEINEIAPGRVFYSTVDNIGNIKVGDFFAVNQLTGEVTIDANSFNLSGLNAIGPFKRNGNTAGVALLEVSDNINLINSIGLNGQDTAPTQFAVKGYIDPISASLDSRLDVVEATASLYVPFSTSVDSRLDVVEATASLYVPFSTSVDSRLDVVEATASLYVPLSSSVDSRLVRLATTGSNTFIGNQTISGSLFVSGSEVLRGTLSASALRVENNTYLGGTLTVTNDTLINGDVTIQSATPNLKLRDTSGGGFSSGYDLRVDTGSFEIYDDTHNRDVLSDFFNSSTSKHTTSLTSEIIIISGSESVTIDGALTASLQDGYVWVGNGSNKIQAAATSSFAKLNQANTFTQSQIISGSLTVTGNLNVFQTASFITVTSSVILGGNTIQLNTFTPAVRYGGIEVIDSGSTGLTGSMLWDSQNDVWIYVNPSGSTYVSARLISGPKSNTLGSEPTLTENKLTKANDGDHLVDSQITDNGVTVNIPYTASIGNIVGLGGPTAFSTSVDYRLSLLQGGESGSATQILALNERVNSVSTYTASVTALNTYTGSVSTSVGILQSTASAFFPFSTSVDSRLVRLATTGSNTFIGNQTISGSSVFTGSTIGNIVSMSIVSNTASMDFNAGSYFTLQLPSSSIPTRLNPTNVRAGQTVSIVVTQASALSGSLSFPTSFKFPTGSYYTASKVVNAVDILTLITVDTSSIYVTSVKSMGI